MAPADLSPPGPEPLPPARLVRSYTLTAGRTRATVELPLEARLRRLEASDIEGDAPRERVLRVCDNRSVAEVSAQVRLPLGVVRVLLGDLVEDGTVQVQATLTERSSREERRTLIERTLRGLRAL